MDGYAQRAKVLKRIGFRNYAAYRDSDLWARIRAAKLRTNPDCFGCGRKATQVHHAAYTLDVMLGHAPEKLYSACGGCHFHAEFTNAGAKVDVKTATKRLKHIRDRNFWKPSRLIAAALHAPEPEDVDHDFIHALERDMD